MSNDVRTFWQQQAETYRESDLATAPDHHYRNLEIRSIFSHLIDGEDVLDVGCGNGYSTAYFAARQRKSNFVGIDYSDEMIANAPKGERLEFSVGDVLTLGETEILKDRRFDTVMCCRLLINLKDWKEQQQGILNMKALLKPGGRLILIENTQEGLDRLNGLREQAGLHAIETRWHNFYIPERKMDKFLKEQFTVDHRQNIGNLYYILSRVVYARLAQDEGAEPDYDHRINEIASSLPLLQGDYSPNWLYVLREKSDARAEDEASGDATMRILDDMGMKRR